MENRKRSERVQVRFPDYLKKEVERIAELKQQAEGNVVVDLVERALQLDPADLNRRIRALELEMDNTLKRLGEVEQKSFENEQVLEVLGAAAEGRREEFAIVAERPGKEYGENDENED